MTLVFIHGSDQLELMLHFKIILEQITYVLIDPRNKTYKKSSFCLPINLMEFILISTCCQPYHASIQSHQHSEILVSNLHQHSEILVSNLINIQRSLYPISSTFRDPCIQSHQHSEILVGSNINQSHQCILCYFFVQNVESQIKSDLPRRVGGISKHA